MNWRSIDDYNLPYNEDALFRIEFEGKPSPVYVVGWIDQVGNVYTHEDVNHDIIGGYLCKKNDLKSEGIKELHWIDPKEIKLWHPKHTAR